MILADENESLVSSEDGPTEDQVVDAALKVLRREMSENRRFPVRHQRTVLFVLLPLFILVIAEILFVFGMPNLNQK